MKVTCSEGTLPANFNFALDFSQDGYDIHIEVRRSDSVAPDIIDYDDLPTIDYEDDPILSSCYRKESDRFNPDDDWFTADD